MRGLSRVASTIILGTALVSGKAARADEPKSTDIPTASANNVDQRVANLIRKLGADTFAVRRAAHVLLAEQMDEATYRQVKLGKKHKDAEIRKRCRDLCVPYEQFLAEKARRRAKIEAENARKAAEIAAEEARNAEEEARKKEIEFREKAEKKYQDMQKDIDAILKDYERPPWVDTYLGEPSDLVLWCLTKGKVKGMKTGQKHGWPKYRAGTKYLVAYFLVAGWSVADIQRELNKMCLEENKRIENPSRQAEFGIVGKMDTSNLPPVPPQPKDE